jgi:hypothetical protein
LTESKNGGFFPYGLSCWILISNGEGVKKEEVVVMIIFIDKFYFLYFYTLTTIKNKILTIEGIRGGCCSSSILA